MEAMAVRKADVNGDPAAAASPANQKSFPAATGGDRGGGNSSGSSGRKRNRREGRGADSGPRNRCSSEAGERRVGGFKEQRRLK